MIIELSNFRKRGFSNLLTNNLRGILAEYIVALSLNIINQPRVEWDAYDLITHDGITIEVKSSAYLQSREQQKLSTINFSIRQTTTYDDQLLKRDNIKIRQARIYVFCLLAHQDKSTVNPLDTNQREFYVLSTKILNDSCYNQKNIGLNKLIYLGATKTNYFGLSEEINKQSKIM